MLEYKANLVFVNEGTGEVFKKIPVYVKGVPFEQVLKDLDRQVIENMADYWEIEKQEQDHDGVSSLLQEQQVKLNTLYKLIDEKDAIIDQRNAMISEIHNELELTKVHLNACREKIWKMRDVLEE